MTPEYLSLVSPTPLLWVPLGDNGHPLTLWNSAKHILLQGSHSLPEANNEDTLSKSLKDGDLQGHKSRHAVMISHRHPI